LIGLLDATQDRHVSFMVDCAVHHVIDAAFASWDWPRAKTSPAEMTATICCSAELGQTDETVDRLNWYDVSHWHGIHSKNSKDCRHEQAITCTKYR